MALCNLELIVYIEGKRYSPELKAEIGKQPKRSIGDTLIALGVLLKEQDLPERDNKGKFLKKDVAPATE